MSLGENYPEIEQLIEARSKAIPVHLYPVATFTMGYLTGKTGLPYQAISEVVEALHEGLRARHISKMMFKQMLRIVEEFPGELNEVRGVLEQLKEGKRVDMIEWIESHYHELNQDGRLKANGRSPARRSHSHSREPSPQPLERDGTLELPDDGTQELPEAESVEVEPIRMKVVPPPQHINNEAGGAEEQWRQSEKDMELARLMQAEFDKEEKSNQKEEDGEVPCEICYVNLYDDEMETLDRCGHLFHKGCMVEAFKSNILNNNFPILCPMEGCQVEATDRDLKCILSDSLFEKYQSHTLKSYADQHGGSVSWCPTANCSYMFFHEEGDNERFECLECKKEYCLNCRVDWHRNMTCKEYQISNTTSEDDKKFLEFVKGKKFKQCPKCKFWVERSEGCDHMTCKCKYEFCYRCGGVFMKCECMEKMRQQMEQRRRVAQERANRRREKRSEGARERRMEQRRRAEEQRRLRDEERQRKKEEKEWQKEERGRSRRKR